MMQFEADFYERKDATEAQLLPPWIRGLLDSCPQSGSGSRAVHRWLLETSDALRHYVPLEQAFGLISKAISRPPKAREIQEALAKAYAECGPSPWSAPQSPPPYCATPERPRWPPPDPGLIDEIVSSRYDPAEPPLASLRAASKPIPVAVDDILKRLFAPRSLLCVGLAKNHCLVARLEKLRFCQRCPFIVPNPMLGPFTRDAAGKRHERCLANTAERRFLVLDFDLRGPAFEPILSRWAPYGVSPQMGMAILITQLTQSAHAPPLSLVTHSGNHSLQAWFYCQGQPDQALGPWFGEAVRLGADPSGWTRCQYFRMPDARRADTGRIQEALFLNPEPIKP
jgi:hypothetical protein